MKMALKRHFRLKRFITVRNIVIILIVLMSMPLVGWMGYKQYKNWSCNRLTANGRDYLQKGDFRNAILCLRKAAQANPKKLEAFRLMAELAEGARSLQAIGWHKQIVRQEPSLENRLSMVRCALRMGDRETAKATLNDVPENQRDNAAYYKSAAALAWAYKQPALAATCFEKALGYNPQDFSVRFDLASIQLHASDTNIVQEARQTLAICKTNLAVRAETLRLLVWDYGRQGAFSEAARYAEELLKEPKSLFNDKLLHLDILAKSSHALINPAILALKAEASTNIQKTFQLGEWLKNNQKAAEAIAWISALPQTAQTNMPLPLLLAECRATLNDWKTLLKYLENQQWGDQEYLRYAIRAKALKALGDKSQFNSSWEKAVAASQSQLESLSHLLRFAAKEAWTNENKEVLWSIMVNHPKEKWANQALQEYFYAQGQTRELQKLYTRMVELDPLDFRAKNNLAMTSLLLDPRSTSAYALARESYNHNPTNAFCISTLAFALHVRDQTAEAIQLLERLDAKQLENPSVAISYGIILGSTGNAKAKPFLDLAEKQRLLPEIADLVRKAKSGI